MKVDYRCTHQEKVKYFRLEWIQRRADTTGIIGDPGDWRPQQQPKFHARRRECFAATREMKG